MYEKITKMNKRNTIFFSVFHEHKKYSMFLFSIEIEFVSQQTNLKTMSFFILFCIELAYSKN
ncbi:hypothetical protein QKK82_gp04 [Mayetiola barley midge adintovirus]|uniref:hypothetical protein n=1 Tax=Mayetiola barley midge adintovirus TaxID=2609858 RepID=UPI002481F9EB|nr:hypothetical protein QKK82_gp04 [Mayetiola barley midge adintovirus]DAC81322.1 TPA_asm: hypothetical protein [Mayetiola barley midge adintovirus]